MTALAKKVLRFSIASLPLLAFPLLAHAGLPKASPVPGGIAIIPLDKITAGTTRPQAWLNDQPVLVAADHHRWVAVVGLALDTAPGSYDLNVKENGTTETRSFEVKPKEYPVQRITLKDKSKVELSDANLARAEREIASIKDLEHHWRATPTTDLTFIIPAKGRLASRFGLRRFFNGEPRSPHAGLDVAVPQGTPVKASGSGQVLATGNYFFNGKTIFIDHGNGLITMYCHMSRFSVHAGETVKKGQRIGYSGRTGRVTGPHLHWSVILNGTMVNPELFLARGPK